MMLGLVCPANWATGASSDAAPAKGAAGVAHTFPALMSASLCICITVTSAWPASCGLLVLLSQGARQGR